MADQTHFAGLDQAFTSLLDSLTGSWPAADLDYVREEIGHAEYGEALENLIALGQRNGVGFTSDHVQSIKCLAATMEIDDAPFVTQLREAA
jgi:hypothetical protein